MAPRDVAASLIRLAVRAYQLVLSPLLGPRCRYLPTCSDYALEAVERFLGMILEKILHYSTALKSVLL